MDDTDVSIDSDNYFEKTMGDLEMALSAAGRLSDANTVVEDQARLFLKMCLGLTPPKNQKQGQGAISRDIGKLFTPVDFNFLQNVASEHGYNHVKAWLTDGAGEKYELDWDLIDTHGYRMESFHKSQRGYRGRTGRHNFNRGKVEGKWRAAMVVPYETLANYRKQLFKRVGWMKSGWVKAWNIIGERSPRWIQRHAPSAPGAVLSELHIVGKPRIVITNRARGISVMNRTVQSAMVIRRQAMVRQIKLIVSGYARDIASGMKVTRKAKRIKPDF